MAVLLVYYCFLRPGQEVRLLKGKYFNFSGGVIRVPAEIVKVNRAKTVTMPDHLIEVLRKYGVDKADPDLYLFGRHGTFGIKPISVNMLTWRFNKYRDALGLSKGIHLYSAKHTGNNAMIQFANITEVMNQNGHTNLNTTQRYLCKKIGLFNVNIQHNFKNPMIQSA